MEETNTKLKTLLAEHLGIEANDINNQDSLISDLHMDPATISEFVESLEDHGVDVSKVDLTEIDTFEELAEALDDSGFTE